MSNRLTATARACVFVIPVFLSLSAQASLVMIVGARADNETAPDAGESYFASTATQVYGTAKGAPFGGATAAITPGISAPPGSCDDCGAIGGFSRTWAGVDGAGAVYRGATGSRGSGSSSLASFGTRDVLDVSGGALSLSLALSLNWHLEGPGDGQARLLGDLGLWRIPDNLHHCDPLVRLCEFELSDDPLANIHFRGEIINRNADEWYLTGYQWDEEYFVSTTFVDGARQVDIADMLPGKYLLVADFQLESACGDNCMVGMDFSHTGYVGVSGSFSSASGYRYPGAPGAAEIPAPATPWLLASALAALGLAAPGVKRRTYDDAGVRAARRAPAEVVEQVRS